VSTAAPPAAARSALRAAAGGAAVDTDETSAVAGTDEDARRGMVTTLDVARAAVRAGVRDVTIIALESPEEIPADPEEIAEAEAEGITILYRRGPHRFVGENGRVTGLETIDVKSVFDDEHRFNPTFLPGTEQVLAADTVILAVGQAADLGLLEGTEVDVVRGGVRTDAATLRTSHPRIWAGGDVAHGPRNLIDAIADGRRAAAAIHAAHGPNGGEGTVGPTGDGVRVELSRRDGYRRLSTAYDAIGRRPVPAVPTARRVGFAEVEAGYDAQDAWLESLRCLRCFDNVMLDPSLCIRCGLCVNRCPPGALSMAHAKELAHD